MTRIPKSVPATNQRGIPSTVIYKTIGIPQPTLSYWIRTGLISPSIRIGKRGRFSRNEWGTTLLSYNDFLELKTIVSLRDKGLSVSRVRKVLDYLRNRKYALDEVDYVTDGKSFFIRLPESGDGVMDILSSENQLVLFKWGEIVRFCQETFKSKSIDMGK